MSGVVTNRMAAVLSTILVSFAITASAGGEDVTGNVCDQCTRHMVYVPFWVVLGIIAAIGVAWWSVVAQLERKEASLNALKADMKELHGVLREVQAVLDDCEVARDGKEFSFRKPAEVLSRAKAHSKALSAIATILETDSEITARAPQTQDSETTGEESENDDHEESEDELEEDSETGATKRSPRGTKVAASNAMKLLPAASFSPYADGAPKKLVRKVTPVGRGRR